MAAKRTTKTAVAVAAEAVASTADNIGMPELVNVSTYSETKSDSVLLNIADAEKILELYKIIKLADSHFHTFQSDSFRNHVQASYKAKNIENAFNALESLVKTAKDG